MVTSKVWTYADLEHTPDDGRGYEILDGALFVTASPARGHQRVIGLLFDFLLDMERAGFGEVYLAPFDVVFDERNVAEPDLLFISTERLAIITEKNVQGAPDLVVEVLAPTTRGRDLKTKLGIYERFGVRHYWIIDPDARTIRRFERGAAYFQEHSALGVADELTCSLFPGHILPVRDLFGH